MLNDLTKNLKNAAIREKLASKELESKTLQLIEQSEDPMNLETSKKDDMTKSKEINLTRNGSIESKQAGE